MANQCIHNLVDSSAPPRDYCSLDIISTCSTCKQPTTKGLQQLGERTSSVLGTHIQLTLREKNEGLCTSTNYPHITFVQENIMIIHRTIQHPGVIILTDLGHRYMYNINYLCTKYYQYSSKDVKNTCVKDGRHLFITWL